MSIDGFGDYLVVTSQRDRHRIRVVLPEARAAFDIGKEEGVDLLIHIIKQRR